jgi:hypothetical protein
LTVCAPFTPFGTAITVAPSPAAEVVAVTMVVPSHLILTARFFVNPRYETVTLDAMLPEDDESRMLGVAAAASRGDDAGAINTIARSMEEKPRIHRRGQGIAGAFLTIENATTLGISPQPYQVNFGLSRISALAKS